MSSKREGEGGGQFVLVLCDLVAVCWHRAKIKKRSFDHEIIMEPERLSDDGYGTDVSPAISPTKEQHSQENKLNAKLINKDSKEFRSKYFTEKVLNNSANGVIYQGSNNNLIKKIK